MTTAKRPRLSTHQREVLNRIERLYIRLDGPVPAEYTLASGACARLVEKGYLTAVENEPGPRGGKRIAYVPVGSP